MTKSSITVLTTVYNGTSYLPECIESILGQTAQEFEFLIIDDESTDQSVACIISYGDPRIRLVENEANMGQAKSLNKGLGLATGDYIARLDQDDVSLPTRLAEQAAYLDAHPDVAVICSWEITIDSQGKKVRTWEGTLANYGDFLGALLLGLCPVWHPSAMFRRDVVARLGNYDPSYAPAEDYELWSRLAANRFSAALVPQYHLLQRVHNQRQSHLQGDRQRDGNRRAQVKLLERFCTHPDRECLAALLRLEPDPCGRHYDKQHVKALRQALDEMLATIEDQHRLTRAEWHSVRRRIAKRVGPGMTYAAALTRLPAPLFYPLFFALSPSLLPHVRSFVANVYHKVRYGR